MNASLNLQVPYAIELVKSVHEVVSIYLAHEAMEVSTVTLPLEEKKCN